MSDDYNKAAKAISQASAMIITAGAGIGVDSGLPDFRGDKGFWKAYPMYERLGMSFVQAANPENFEEDPAFGWGFYGHRTNLYRKTVPHAGFDILKSWIDRFELNHFIVTSNVDGQFQKAGYAEDRILEVHGSIHHLQCTTPCGDDIWSNHETIAVNEATMRALNIPRCRHCNRVARPNILMFGDYSWLHQRTGRQEVQFESFLNKSRNKPMVVIEMGAGTGIPTIRHLSERLGHQPSCTVIRINPREPYIQPPHLSLAEGSLSALQRIDKNIST